MNFSDSDFWVLKVIMSKVVRSSLDVWHDRLFMWLQASIAKLETSVSFFSDKLELKLYGFNEKLPILLSKILVITKSFLPTDDRFKV